MQVVASKLGWTRLIELTRFRTDKLPQVVRTGDEQARVGAAVREAMRRPRRNQRGRALDRTPPARSQYPHLEEGPSQ